MKGNAQVKQSVAPLPRWAVALVHVLFFMSGAVGLVYEVVWMRMLSFVFGNTTYAVSVILAVFLGGLAIGAWLFGRAAERRKDHLRMYALLEAGAAVLALLLPLLLLDVSTPIYTWIYRSAQESIAALTVARLLLSGAVLVAPAILMGGTLPVMCRFLAPREQGSEAYIGRLYGLNTLGAVTGSFLAGFVLMPFLGLRWANGAGALVGLWIALTALLLYRALRSEDRDAPVPAPVPAKKARAAKGAARAGVATDRDKRLKWVLVAFAFSGFAALAYEVLWTRLFAFHFVSSVYAFSMMLCVYLLGMGLGSLVYSLLLSRSSRPVRWFIILEVLIGLSAAATLPLYLLLPKWLGHLAAQGGFQGHVEWMFLCAVVIMAIPTLLIGAVFPLVCGIWARATGQVGKGVGEIYVVNSAGTVLGSFAAGFLLIPAVGTPHSLLLVAGLNIFAGLMVWAAASRGPGQLAAKSLAAVGLPLLLALGVGRAVTMEDLVRSLHADPGVKIEWLQEGIDGTVTIERVPDFDRGLSGLGPPRIIYVNGVNVAGTSFDLQTTQKLQAHLPMLIHPHPQRVMQIGFGAGGTAYSISQYPLERVDCVELTKAVIDASPEFPEINKGVLKDKRFHVYVEDARTFVRHTPRRYDLILSDLVHPMLAGEGFFYSVDYLRDCKKRLAPGGFFSTWAPLHGLRPEDLKVMVRSIQAVFPYVYIWHSSGGENQFCVIHGRLTPLQIDYAAFARRMALPGVRNDLAQIGLNRPEQVLSLMLYDHKAVKRWLADSDQVDTDDNGYLEFVGMRRSQQFNIREANFLLTFPDFVLNGGGSIADYLLAPERDSKPLRENLRRETEANQHLLRGRLYRLAELDYLTQVEFRRALAVAPDHFVARSLLGITQRQLDYTRLAATGLQATPWWRDKWLASLIAAGRLQEAASWAEFIRSTYPSEAGEAVVIAALREQAEELKRLLAAMNEQASFLGIPPPAFQQVVAQLQTVAGHRADPEAWRSLADTYAGMVAATGAVSAAENQAPRRLSNFGLQAVATLQEMAVARYQQALSLSPGNATTRYRLAWAQSVMGDYRAAIALLEGITEPPVDSSGKPIPKDLIAARIADLREKERNPFYLLARYQQAVLNYMAGPGG